jgi:hypothetical protein
MKMRTLVFIIAELCVAIWTGLSMYFYIRGLPMFAVFIAIVVCYMLVRYYFYKKEDTNKQKDSL